LEKIYKEELLKKVDQMSAKYYPKFEELDIPDVEKVTIRKMKTRWGVCNYKSRRITLNLDLAKLPDIYLEYILCHEWSHLLHPNHSAKF
jgi:predicted metal-dependent hydrolase